MSRIKIGLKDTVLTRSAIFLPDTLKVTGSTISTPKSYDEHPRQVKYGSPPPPPPPVAVLFRNGSGTNGTDKIRFTLENLVDPFHFLSDPFHIFRLV